MPNIQGDGSVPCSNTAPIGRRMACVYVFALDSHVCFSLRVLPIFPSLAWNRALLAQPVRPAPEGAEGGPPLHDLQEA